MAKRIYGEPLVPLGRGISAFIGDEGVRKLMEREDDGHRNEARKEFNKIIRYISHYYDYNTDYRKKQAKSGDFAKFRPIVGLPQ